MRAVLVWSLLALSAAAHADPTHAKELFAEGRALIEGADQLGDPAAKAAKTDAACEKFAESLALDPQLGTQLNLADCRQRQGKLVEAYAIYEAAQGAATRAHDRSAFVGKQLTALAARLVKVELHVSEPERAGLVVELAGRAVPRDGWQHAVAEPGTLVVRASAPGRQSVTLKRDAIAGSELSIDVPGLEPEHGEPPPVATVTTPPPTSIVVAPPPPPVQIERSRAPYFVMGAGGVVLLASLALAIDARLRYDDAIDAHDANRANTAVSQSDVATVVGIAGAVTEAIGVVLWIRSRHRAAAPTADSVGLVTIGEF